MHKAYFSFRQMTWHLRSEKNAVNEERISRLMLLMGPLSANCGAIACSATDADQSEGKYSLAFHPCLHV